MTENVFELINRMKRCQELAIERMEETRDKRKEWYDRGTVTWKFKPGDHVLVMATAKQIISELVTAGHDRKTNIGD